MSLTPNVQQWLEKLSKAISNSLLIQRARSHPLVSSASLLTATLVAIFLRHDYLIYMSLGPGGLPYNVFGWAIANLIMKPLAFGADDLSTTPYENSTDPSYLPEHFPPQRGKERPKMSPHPIPHRQLSQHPSDEAKKELMSRVKEIMQQAKATGAVEIKQSGLELHTEAMFVVPENVTANSGSTAAAATKGIKGEFAHVHATGDHSMHLVLSATDCKKVLNAGWGQRHAFDGRRLVKALFHVDLPMTYVMIYAPRNKEEIDVACRLVKAAVAYNTGVSLE